MPGNIGTGDQIRFSLSAVMAGITGMFTDTRQIIEFRCANMLPDTHTVTGVIVADHMANSIGNMIKKDWKGDVDKPGAVRKFDRSSFF